MINKVEKEVIYRWIEKQAYEGFSADLSLIAARITALIHIRKSSTRYEYPSRTWLYIFTHSKEFKKRIKMIKSKPIDHKRKTATDVKQLQSWIRATNLIFRQQGIFIDLLGASRIWNFDEGGCRVGIMRGGLVFVPAA